MTFTVHLDSRVSVKMQNPGGIGSRLISRTSAAPVFVALCGAAATSEIKYEIRDTVPLPGGVYEQLYINLLDKR